MHLAQKISLRVRLGKNIGGAQANSVLLRMAAGVTGDSEKNRGLPQVLALADPLNHFARAGLGNDRRENDQLRRLRVEGADGLIRIVRERRLHGLARESLPDTVDIPRLVLDNENVFRHVGSLRMG